MAARLEAGDSCGARSEAEALQSDAIAAVNARRIPRRFQEELLGSVAALVESVECVPPPVAEEDEHAGEDEDDDGSGGGKGKKKGRDKE